MKKTIPRAVFLMMIFTIPGMLPAETSATLSAVTTYDQLVSAIRGVRSESQARVEKAVEQEKVREAWETGKLIDEHVLQHKERADYADRTLVRLAGDLGASETELRYMLQFARTYPIHRPADELSWSHYESLMAVNDLEERKALAEKAVKEKWTRDQVRAEVKKRKASKSGTQVPEKETQLTAKPGKPGTYRMVKATVGPETGKVVVDLGFSNYYRTSKDLRFKEGDIIEATPPVAGASAPSDMIKLSKRTSADLYTYRVWVVDVLDGDTVKVVVDLGFGVRSVQTLRLRGIDCPELVSKEGKEAKEFVEQKLGIAGSVERGAGKAEDTGEGSVRGSWSVDRGTRILIKTTKSDKYDRYLADVYLLDAKGKQIYLNNELLEKGLAVRVSE